MPYYDGFTSNVLVSLEVPDGVVVVVAVTAAVAAPAVVPASVAGSLREPEGGDLGTRWPGEMEEEEEEEKGAGTAAAAAGAWVVDVSACSWT